MSALGLGLGLGLGAHRIVDRYGNMPATFTISAGFVDTGTKRINFSEPVTLTITGSVTLSIGSTVYQSGDTIPVASTYHELTITNPGEDAGTITFGKRKQITYLRFQHTGSSAITCDITGMGLTYLRLDNIGSSAITCNITGMELTSLYLSVIGSSSAITGDITGMELIFLYLNSLGSSLIYGTNLLNITDSFGIQLLGNTVFATAAENRQLIIDAADGTWIHSTIRPFTITAGTINTDPGWGSVSAAMATLKTKTTARIIPDAWLQSNGGTWPANWDA